MNYVLPIRPENENEYVKKQIIMADKAFDELKTKKIEVPNIIFYETYIKSNVSDKDNFKINISQKHNFRKTQKRKRTYVK